MAKKPTRLRFTEDDLADSKVKKAADRADKAADKAEKAVDNLGQIMVYLVTLEVMVLLIQFMTTVILQNVFFGFLSFLPFVAAIGGFEYAYQKKASSATEKTKNFRKKFYKISAWLGLYFPIRFIVSVAARFYPRP